MTSYEEAADTVAAVVRAGRHVSAAREDGVIETSCTSLVEALAAVTGHHQAVTTAERDGRHVVRILTEGTDMTLTGADGRGWPKPRRCFAEWRHERLRVGLLYARNILVGRPASAEAVSLWTTRIGAVHVGVAPEVRQPGDNARFRGRSLCRWHSRMPSPGLGLRPEDLSAVSVEVMGVLGAARIWVLGVSRYPWVPRSVSLVVRSEDGSRAVALLEREGYRVVTVRGDRGAMRMVVLDHPGGGGTDG